MPFGFTRKNSLLLDAFRIVRMDAINMSATKPAIQRRFWFIFFHPLNEPSIRASRLSSLSFLNSDYAVRDPARGRLHLHFSALSQSQQSFPYRGLR